MSTFADGFGGFGGATAGAIAAGLKPTWTIEIDPQIAEVNKANLGHDVIVADLLEINPKRLEAPSIMHWSPPCTRASVANSKASESSLDIALANKIIEFTEAHLPQVVTIENVWGYRRFQAWQGGRKCEGIQDALFRLGYWLHIDHVNAASYGVPQSRKRMIVRAVRGGFVPYLPEPVPWVGWYAAIEDLLPALPESRFARWQLARLPELLQTCLIDSKNMGQEWGKLYRLAAEPAITVVADGKPGHMPRAFLVGDQERQVAAADDPAFTVRAGENGGAVPRAWLVDGRNASESGQLTIRDSDRPSFTITNQGKGIARALLEQGRVVAMTPRALARFQSFSDDFVLPDNARLAAKGLGNACSPLLMQRIYESLMEAAL